MTLCQQWMTAVGAAVLWIVPGCACQAAPTPKLPKTLIVDAHAHVFGASSLPIEGFLYQSLQVPRWLARLVDRALRWWSGGSRALEQDPPTDAELLQAAQAILAELELERGAPDRALRMELEDSGWITREELLQADDDLGIVLRGVLATGEERARAIQDPRFRELVEEAESNPEWGSGLAHAGEEARAPLERSVADGLGIVLRNLRWAELLTRSTETIGRRLAAQYPDVDLFLASMMDMRSWFDGAPPENSMEQQLADATALIVSSGGRILPLVAYDPWRDADGSVLPWVKEAVEERGCVGVKLYPPLGYKPSANNSGPWPTSPGESAQQWPDDAAQWDARLEALFQWCDDEDVPLAVHCSDPGAEARPGRGRFADPALWAPVLAAHPRLRVNFAHFGGIDDFAATGQSGWTWTVAQWTGGTQYPHVFGDLGHTTELLSEDPRYPELFDELLGASPNVAERLLYGSDWHMVVRTRGAGEYLRGHADFFAPRGEEFLAAYLGGNALRWLGLDDKTGKAWQRLEPVLRAAGVDTSAWPVVD